MQHFKDSQITACIVEIHDWPHAVMKVFTDDYFDKGNFVRKLESDGSGGFKRGDAALQWVGTVGEFNLIKGKLTDEVSG